MMRAIYARGVVLCAMSFAAAGLVGAGEPSASFTAQYKSENVRSLGGETETLTGKIWVSEGRVRSETLDEGHVMAIIFDPAKHNTFMLVPDQGFYQNVSKRFYEDINKPRPRIINYDLIPGGPADILIYDVQNPCAHQEGIVCMRTGSDTVAGRSCDTWQFTDGDGTKWTECIDAGLAIVIKRELAGQVYTLTNIKAGPQNPQLFRVPSNLKLTELDTALAEKEMEAAARQH